MEKIPNRKALHDFLENQCRRYCLPIKYMSLKFGKKVLAGAKKLYFKKQILEITHVPNYPQLKGKFVWEAILAKPQEQKTEILKYFPDYEGNARPPKEYMLNVRTCFFTIYSCS